jgi:PTS system nitrogen regulatory IIA component
MLARAVATSYTAGPAGRRSAGPVRSEADEAAGALARPLLFPHMDEALSSPTKPYGSAMALLDFLAPAAVVPALRASSKKQALQELSGVAARLTGLEERAIYDVLWQRERLGSTGIGDGVAIPHGKLPKLDRLFGLVARLEKPIDFEALDDQPVDLIFLLLAPENAGADHLKALARVARLLRDPQVAQKLRDSRDAQALYAVLALPPATAA